MIHCSHHGWIGTCLYELRMTSVRTIEKILQSIKRWDPTAVEVETGPRDCSADVFPDILTPRMEPHRSLDARWGAGNLSLIAALRICLAGILMLAGSGCKRILETDSTTETSPKDSNNLAVASQEVLVKRDQVKDPASVLISELMSLRIPQTGQERHLSMQRGHFCFESLARMGASSVSAIEQYLSSGSNSVFGQFLLSEPSSNRVEQIHEGILGRFVQTPVVKTRVFPYSIRSGLLQVLSQIHPEGLSALERQLAHCRDAHEFAVCVNVLSGHEISNMGSNWLSRIETNFEGLDAIIVEVLGDGSRIDPGNVAQLAVRNGKIQLDVVKHIREKFGENAPGVLSAIFPRLDSANERFYVAGLGLDYIGSTAGDEFIRGVVLDNTQPLQLRLALVQSLARANVLTGESVELTAEESEKRAQFLETVMAQTEGTDMYNLARALMGGLRSREL